MTWDHAILPAARASGGSCARTGGILSEARRGHTGRRGVADCPASAPPRTMDTTMDIMALAGATSEGPERSLRALWPQREGRVTAAPLIA